MSTLRFESIFQEIVQQPNYRLVADLVWYGTWIVLKFQCQHAY